jgi:argininosuccinate lyase
MQSSHQSATKSRLISMTSNGDSHPAALADRVLEVGARIELGPSERLVQTAFKRELEAQAELFDAMSLVDLAHSLVMMDLGVIPRDQAKLLIAALLELQARPQDFVAEPRRGDLYTNREAWLTERTTASRWLGAGRARREVTTTAFLIKIRTDLLALGSALTRTGEVLTARARKERDSLLPDYTYLLAGQPTSFGHYLLGFVYPILRDLDRLRGLFERINRSPAGCGSTNGSRLPQDRTRQGRLLGFTRLVTHARDAMWQADLPIETTAMLTASLINIDRLAEDLQIFSTEEFGLLELADSHARASKIMPQKKNPFALTHIRGTASAMIGTLTACAVMGRTPSGQPDNRMHIYGDLPRAIADTQAAVELLGEVVDSLKLNPTRGCQRLDESFALATDLAEVLVLRCGLDFRSAHKLVGRLIRDLVNTGCSFKGLTADAVAQTAKERLGIAIDLDSIDLEQALDPHASVTARSEPGGAAPEPMDAMFTECTQALARTALWLQHEQQYVLATEAALLDMARSRVGVTPA